MTTDRELLEQARDALTSLFTMKVDDERGPRCSAALMALNDRLAQPEAEPTPADSRVDNLAALVRRLAHSLQRAAPNNDLPKKALDYLKRNDLAGDVIRNSLAAFNMEIERLDEAPTPPVQPIDFEDEVLNQLEAYADAGLAAQQTRLTCPDGGTCHHFCTEPCARRDKLGCVPLTISGLNDDWSKPTPAMIPWPGGERPVSGDTEVIVRLRSGREHKMRAGFRTWQNFQSDGSFTVEYCEFEMGFDIVGYRVVREGGK